MKITELRIGNYVIENYLHFQKQRDERVITVETILERGINADQFDDYSYIGLDLLKPIPLTEEWLLKFGFKEHGEWFIIDNYPVSLHVSIKHDKTTFGYNEEYEIENIKHVHQLQNLYFALTGWELKIKESTLQT